MKQTAVEWFQEQIIKIVNGTCELSEIQIFEQAKEIEKQQMKDASCPYVGGWENDEFEYWYNETFKNTEQ